MNFNLEHKQTLIYILHEIASVDGDKNPEELRFINEISNRLNLSSNDIINTKTEANFQLRIPKLENERLFFFFHALQMIEMDKKITKSEINLLRKIGFKLGLSTLLVNDLIKLNLSYLGEFIPEDKIPSILKKYLN